MVKLGPMELGRNVRQNKWSDASRFIVVIRHVESWIMVKADPGLHKSNQESARMMMMKGIPIVGDRTFATMCHGGPIYWFRQSFILITVMIQSLSNGVMLAFPSVLNPAILDPDAAIKATPSQASWLASILGIAGLVGFFILSPVMQIYGRKAVHILKNFAMAIGWITFYFSESLTTLFIARTIQGLAMGGIFINMIIIGEYVSPSRRGYFTTLQKLAISSGTLFCHLMAVWFTWREIVAATILVPIISIILTFFWPESPFFLAMRGRYDECEQSFHWLNGTSRSAELQELIREQRKCREEKTMLASNNKLKRMLKQFKRPDFWKSFGIVALLCITLDLSGRNYFKAYVVQIMMSLLQSKSLAVYISVASDLSVLTALLLSCLVVKYFGRRQLLFSFGGLSIFVLFITSLLLYIKSLNILTVWPSIAPGLVLFVNFIVHIGVSPICFVVMGEIFPLELKGLGCCMNGLVYTASYGLVLKMTPVLMDSVSLGGTYLIYGIGMSICLLILYFILPETKDKTLLDIEHNLRGVQKSDTYIYNRIVTKTC